MFGLKWNSKKFKKFHEHPKKEQMTLSSTSGHPNQKDKYSRILLRHIYIYSLFLIPRNQDYNSFIIDTVPIEEIIVKIVVWFLPLQERTCLIRRVFQISWHARYS